MLQGIRDKTGGLVAWFVLGMIIIMFGFFPVGDFLTSDRDPVLVEIGGGLFKKGEQIRQSQLENAYQNAYQGLLARLGENFRPGMIDEKQLRERVLKDMEQELVLRQYSEASGYRASDALLLKALYTEPEFQEGGKFSKAAYEAALARQGLTTDKYEARGRNVLAIYQMRDGVVDTAFVTDAEVEQSYRLSNQQRWLSYAVFEAGKYSSQITLTDAQLKEQYETDQAKYMAPERIKLAYLELSMDAMPKSSQPPAGALKVVYDADKDTRFSSEEQRHARHILINFGADKDAAKKKAEALVAKAQSGGFEGLVSENTNDSGTRSNGGDLGWITKGRGQVPDKLEKAIYDMKAGEVAGPIESEFGWHVIKLEEVKAAVTRPFEEAGVQKELLDLWQTREQQRLFQEKSEKLEQLAFENNASLDVPAKELGLTVQTTDWITRAGGEGITANDAVKQAAFSTEVAKDGDNSKPIPLTDTRIVVLRKAEYEAAHQKPFAEVTDAVRQDALAAAAKAKARADAAEVLKAAKAGTPLADAAKAKGIELKSPGLIKRDDKTNDDAIVKALFKMPRPAAGAAQFSDVTLANGDVAVIGLSAVQDGALDKNSGEAIQVRNQLRQVLAGTEFAAYRKGMEDVVKVKIKHEPVEAEAVDPLK